jgi:hypothetical protein
MGDQGETGRPETVRRPTTACGMSSAPLAAKTSPRDQASAPGIEDRGFLIRGFGVAVPGGAPVIKALTWWFSPDQSRSRVYCGRLGARGVLCSRWTKPALAGTRRTGWQDLAVPEGPARAKVDRWNQGVMRRRATNSRQSCARADCGKAVRRSSDCDFRMVPDRDRPATSTLASRVQAGPS